MTTAGGTLIERLRPYTMRDQRGELTVTPGPFGDMIMAARRAVGDTGRKEAAA